MSAASKGLPESASASAAANATPWLETAISPAVASAQSQKATRRDAVKCGAGAQRSEFPIAQSVGGVTCDAERCIALDPARVVVAGAVAVGHGRPGGVNGGEVAQRAVEQMRRHDVA